MGYLTTTSRKVGQSGQVKWDANVRKVRVDPESARSRSQQPEEKLEGPRKTSKMMVKCVAQVPEPEERLHGGIKHDRTAYQEREL